MSTTTDSSVFCNTKVAMGLRELFAFTHHERLLLWDPGWSLFYKPSVTTESADTKLHWQGEGLLSKQTDISWFLGFPCIFPSPFHHMFNPRSFRVIPLYYYMDLFILISLHVWIPWVVTDIWWKFPINSPIKNIFTEKKGKECWHVQYLFSLHVTLDAPPPPKKGWNSCVETGEKSSFIHFLNCSSSWGWCRAAACSSCHWARMDRLPVFSRVNLTANYVH